MIRIKKINLDTEQKRSISDISVAAAQLSAGSIVIPFALSGIDSSKGPMIILGLIFTITFCLVSVLIFRRKGRK